MSTPTCKCKHVLEDTIKEVVAKGADSLDKVKMQTGAATGACKGARCKHQIEEMIHHHK